MCGGTSLVGWWLKLWAATARRGFNPGKPWRAPRWERFHNQKNKCVEDKDQMQDNNYLEAKKKRNKFRKGTASVAAAAAESLQSVRLWATPQTAAHPAPPSLGFSRRGYWSGVPLPSPASVTILFHFRFIMLFLDFSHTWNDFFPS